MLNGAAHNRNANGPIWAHMRTFTMGSYGNVDDVFKKMSTAKLSEAMWKKLRTDPGEVDQVRALCDHCGASYCRFTEMEHGVAPAPMLRPFKLFEIFKCLHRRKCVIQGCSVPRHM